MKITIAENFIRSANAPAIRPGVMMAKVIWNIMNTVSGIVFAVSFEVPAPRVNGLSQLSAIPFSMKREKSPT